MPVQGQQSDLCQEETGEELNVTARNKDFDIYYKVLAATLINLRGKQNY